MSSSFLWQQIFK